MKRETKWIFVTLILLTLGIILIAMTLLLNQTNQEEFPISEQEQVPNNQVTQLKSSGITNRYEAEDAELTGLTIGSSDIVSGQKFVEGFDDPNDRLRFNIELEESGTYMITIRYKTFGGDKPNPITLNDIKLADYTFLDSSVWKDAIIGQFELNKGSNTFDIGSTWGWIAIDYIELTGGSGGAVTSVELVTGEDATTSDEAITLIAKADNASEYRFFVKAPAGDWTELNTYSMQHQFTWLPPAAGQYEVKVYARGLGSTTDFEAEDTAHYTVLPEYHNKPLVNPVFGDNMVLQRDSAQTEIWGWAQPGQQVSVSLDGQAKSEVSADEHGRWTMPIGKHQAGGPHKLSIVSSDQEIILQNILFGDVWLASGQSNMEFRLSQALEAENEIKQATESNIRYMTVPTMTSRVPLTMISNTATWKEISPATAGDTTAVGYFFAKKLAEATDVPIGLLFSAVGGTKAESWTSYDTLQGMTAYASSAEKIRSGASVIETSSSPTILYNGMIAPLTPYALKGVLWYQGESNWGEQQYKELLPTFMKDWRTVFHNNELPFVIIQISSFGALQTEENPAQTYPGLSEIREAQLVTVLRDKYASLVVTTDVGDPLDIHPTNKQDVGMRAALSALGKWYGHNIKYSGPIYESMEQNGNEIALNFSHVGKGLMAGVKEGLQPVKQAEGNALLGFAIAGEDGIFHPAHAVIKGKQVIVSSANVEKPVHVRHGWNDAPVINLYNKDGLPASPFRTDLP